MVPSEIGKGGEQPQGHIVVTVEILTAVAAVVGAVTGLLNSYQLTRLTSRVETNERLLNTTT